MAKPVLSLPTLCLFLLLLCFNSGLLRLVHGQAPGQGSWCVAKPSSSDDELTANINYACGYVDCSKIQKDGACFYPQTLINHASFVMNIYYQEQGRHFWNCDFKKSGIVVVTDPSKLPATTILAKLRPHISMNILQRNSQFFFIFDF